MAIKALVTGDLHIGRRSTYVPVGDVETSARYIWQKIVDYAITHNYDLLLLTGDIVDKDNKYFEATGALRVGFQKLEKAGIRVYMVCGNHDWDVLPAIIANQNFSNIHLLGLEGQWETGIYSKGNESICFAGWSFPDKYCTTDPSSSFPSLQVIAGDMPVIALLHGQISANHNEYAPINKLNLLNNTVVDAWLLGHIHKTDILNPRNPLVFYPGSPQALHPNEQGLHGTFTLTICGKNIEYHQDYISSVRYETVYIDVSFVADKDSFRNTVIAGLQSFLMDLENNHYQRYLVCDICFVGESGIIRQLNDWSDELMNYNYDGQYQLLIRKLIFRINPDFNRNDYLGESSYMGALVRTINSFEECNSDVFPDLLLQEWKKLFTKLISLPVYAPLKTMMNGVNTEEMAKEYLIEQSKKILAELSIQLNNED